MKFASIERIVDLKPIDGADNICIAEVLGWHCVVKKHDFKVGDLCVFIPIDTVVNASLPVFSFLFDPKHPTRINIPIKTKKIRGVYSQGLVLPLSAFEGLDIGNLIDVKKYHKPGSEEIVQYSGVKEFPTHLVSKTDEANVKSNIQVFKEMLNKTVYLTMKMDGSSMTVICTNDTFTVCSRNFELTNKDHMMWKKAIDLDLENKIRQLGRQLALQMEFCGYKINGNPLSLTDHEVYVFNVKDLDTNKYLGWYDIEKICTELGIKTVPLLDILKLTSEHKLCTIEGLQEYANTLKYDGYARLNGIDAEGVVIRPLEYEYSPRLGRILSLKMINQKYRD